MGKAPHNWGVWFTEHAHVMRLIGLVASVLGVAVYICAPGLGLDLGPSDIVVLLTALGILSLVLGTSAVGIYRRVRRGYARARRGYGTRSKRAALESLGLSEAPALSDAEAEALCSTAGAFLKSMGKAAQSTGAASSEDIEGALVRFLLAGLFGARDWAQGSQTGIDSLVEHGQGHLEGLKKWNCGEIPGTKEEFATAVERHCLDVLGVRALPSEAAVVADVSITLVKRMVSHLTHQNGYLISFPEWHRLLCESISACDEYFATSLETPAAWVGEKSFACARFYRIIDCLKKRATELKACSETLKATRVFVADTDCLNDSKESQAWSNLVAAHGRDVKLILRDREALIRDNAEACETFSLFGACGYYWAIIKEGPTFPLLIGRKKIHFALIRLELDQGMLKNNYGTIQQDLSEGCEWVWGTRAEPVQYCNARIPCAWKGCPVRPAAPDATTLPEG